MPDRKTRFFHNLLSTASFLKKNKIESAFFLLAASTWASVFLFGSKFYADEKYHYKQIGWFSKGKFEMIDTLTTIPGYHAFITCFTSWFDDLSFLKVRLISFAITLMIIPVFYLLAKKLGDSNPIRKTLLLLFMPIGFIYYPLIYTDIFSAILVLAAILAVSVKRTHLASLITIASITVRQNNIIWHVFIWVYEYLEAYGTRFSITNIIRHIRSTPVFFIGLAAFAAFVYTNGGIAIGDKQSHQAGFYLGNIYFFLAISAILLLPLTISRLTEWYRQRTSPRPIFWVPVALAGISLSLTLFFLPPELHAYNYDHRFLRNIFLLFVYQEGLWIYASLVFFGVLSLAMLPLKTKGMYLIYPFIALYLIPSWLIEQRYAIIPLLLLLLFKKDSSNRLEWIQIIFFSILSLSLTLMIINTKIFF